MEIKISTWCLNKPGLYPDMRGAVCTVNYSGVILSPLPQLPLGQRRKPNINSRLSDNQWFRNEHKTYSSTRQRNHYSIRLQCDSMARVETREIVRPRTSKAGMVAKAHETLVRRKSLNEIQLNSAWRPYILTPFFIHVSRCTYVRGILRNVSTHPRF